MKKNFLSFILAVVMTTCLFATLNITAGANLNNAAAASAGGSGSGGGGSSGSGGSGGGGSSSGGSAVTPSPTLRPDLNAESGWEDIPNGGAGGTFSGDLKWFLDEEGTLTIGGTGVMVSWEDLGGGFNVPWEIYAKRIRRVNIGAEIAGISKNYFWGCSNVAEFNVDEAGRYYSSSDGNLFSKDGTKLIFYAAGKEEATYTVPDGVTSIGEFAFDGSSLLSVNIGAGVTDIGQAVFDNCPKLREINVSEGNRYYCSIDGVLYSKDKTIIMRYPMGKSETMYEAPDGVKTIEAYAFSSYEPSALEIVILPASLKEVREYAFEMLYQKVITILYKGDYFYGMSGGHNYIYSFDGNLAKFNNVRGVYHNGVVDVDVSFEYIIEGGNLIAALYNDGELIDLKTRPMLKNEVGNVSMQLDAGEEYDGYVLKAFFWKQNSMEALAEPVTSDVFERVETDAVLESAHPYENDINDTQTYTYDGECESILVTFSEDTYTEPYFDIIRIYGDRGRLYGEYSGREAAGITVEVPGDTVEIELESDESNVKYGYKTESIAIIR